VEAHGWRFGLIYNDEQAGQGPRGSDSLYHARTLEYYTTFADSGGSPENILIMSWYPRPTNTIPETEDFTFTNLVKDFAGLMGRVEVSPVSPVIARKLNISSYPNPFNAVTNLQFNIDNPGWATLSILDITGREIARLAESHLTPGTYSTSFDATDLPAGLYYARLSSKTASPSSQYLVRSTFTTLIVLK